MLNPKESLLCQIRVFNEENEVVSDFDLFIRKHSEEAWQAVVIEQDEATDSDYFLAPTPGLLFVLVKVKGYEDEEQKINIKTNGPNELVFDLGPEGHSFIQVANTKFFRKAPEKENTIGVVIKANTPEDELEAVNKEMESLGFEADTEQALEGDIIKYQLKSGALTKEVENNLKQSFQKLDPVLHIGEVIHEDQRQTMLLTDEIVIKFIADATREQIDQVLNKYQLEITQEFPAGIYLYMVRSKVLRDKELLEQTKNIQDEEWVEHVELNMTYTKEHDINPNDTLAREQWDHRNLIDTPTAWDGLRAQAVANTYGTTTVRIAVIDGGIDSTHPDFAGNLSDGVTPKRGTLFDFNNLALNLNNPTGSHGTCTASAATGIANNNQGTAGVAGNCQLLPIQYSSRGNVAFDSQMFTWIGGFNPGNANITNVSAAPGVNAAAHIMSNSWGPTPPINAINSVTLITAFELLTNFGRGGRGILFFFSTGNGNRLYENQRPYGRNPRTMAIGASTLTNAGRVEVRAPYSNYGPGVEFCAPSHTSYAPAINARHNPTANYAAFTATHRLSSANQYRTTTVSGPAPVAAPPNSIGLTNTRGITRNRTMVLIGALGAANTEAFLVTGGGPPNNFITLHRAMLNVHNPGTPVTIFDGNTPGVFANGTTLNTAPNPNIAAGTRSITVANTTGFRAGGAVFIEAPGNANAESHAISSVVGNTVNLVSPLNKQHNNGVAVSTGPADYKNNFTGTSYATPVCAGIAGLILSANPNLTWVEVRQIMRDTARKIDVGTNGVVVGARRYGKWMDANRNLIVNAAGALNPLVPAVSTTLTALANRLVTLTSAAGFEVGQAIMVSQGANREFRVVTNVNTGTNTITVDANFVTAFTNGATVQAGRKPHYSAFYGYGRVDAAAAVAATVQSLTNYRELRIRNTLADNGTAATVQVQSPDIWVTNNSLTVNGHTYTLHKNVDGLDDLTFTQSYTGNTEAEFFH